MWLIPNSWGAARRPSVLTEANDCHEPAGRVTGGRFCSRLSGEARNIPSAFEGPTPPVAPGWQKLTETQAGQMLPKSVLEQQHDVALEQAASKAVAMLANGSSKQVHRSRSGYTVERLVTQRAAVDALTNPNARISGHPVAIFMGGLPGAGKTRATEKTLDLSTKQVINADDVKAKLPEYASGIGAFYLHDESSDIAERMLKEAASEKRDLVFDSTMGNPDNVFQTMVQLKRLGYRVEIRYVDLPVAQSIDRAVARFVKSGRFVPPDYIRGLARVRGRQVTSRNKLTFDALKGVADAFVRYDGVTNEVLEKKGRVTR